jgi:DNA-binding transcriptional LysR family regulator
LGSTREIEALEKALGMTLLVNEGNYWKTTAKGRRLYNLLMECSNNLGALVNSKMEMPDSLTIGGDSTAIQWLINPRMTHIRALLPSVKLNLKERNFRQVQVGFSSGSLDFGILDEERLPGDLGWKAVPLLVLDAALFIPCKLLRGREPTPATLATIPFATLDPSGTYTWRLKEASQGAGYQLRFDTFYGRMGDVYQAVQLGMYAAILPALAHEVMPLPEVDVFTSPELLKELSYAPTLVWPEHAEPDRPWLPKAAKLLHEGITQPLMEN